MTIIRDRVIRRGMALFVAAVVGFAARAENPADFEVPAVPSGKVFKLSEARGRWVALHFLLKTECPVCLRQTREYHAKGAGLPNLVQVFLKPDSVEQIEAWVAKLKPSDGGSIMIHRDADARLATAYGVPDGYRFHGEVVHFPAMILLGPDGREVFRHVGTNNSDRVRFEEIQKRVTGAKKP